MKLNKTQNPTVHTAKPRTGLTHLSDKFKDLDWGKGIQDDSETNRLKLQEKVEKAAGEV